MAREGFKRKMSESQFALSEWQNYTPERHEIVYVYEDGDLTNIVNEYHGDGSTLLPNITPRATGGGGAVSSVNGETGAVETYLVNTKSGWEGLTAPERVIPNEKIAYVKDNTTGAVLYSVMGDGSTDVFSLRREFYTPVTETSLPAGGLVFDRPRLYEITQAAAIDIVKAASGHYSGNQLIPIYIRILGDETNTITYSITEIDLAGDALDNTKSNFMCLASINGSIMSSTNQISILDDNASPTISNFVIEDAYFNRIYFTSSEVITGSTFANFTVASPSKTITALFINSGQTTGHYFTVNSNFINGETPTIAYSGGDDIQDSSGNLLQSFTATAITNNVGSFIPLYEDTVARTYNNTISNVVNMGDAAQYINNTNFEILTKYSPTDGQPSSNQVLCGARSTSVGNIGGFWALIDTNGNVQVKYSNNLDSVTTLTTTSPVFPNGATAQTFINIRKSSQNVTLYINEVLTSLDSNTITGVSEIGNENSATGGISQDDSIAGLSAGTQKGFLWHNDLLSAPQRDAKILEYTSI